MNKSFLLILICVLCFSAAQAQEYSFGIKGGINYAMGGELTGMSSGEGYNTDTFHAESQMGFHGGAFFQLSFGRFFIRPEAIYNTMETEFPFPVQPSTYAVEKVSVPILFGFNVIGPLDVYAGPAYQDILNVSLEGDENPENTIVVQNTPLAAHVGVKASVGRFELDLRYDHSLASRENQVVDIHNRDYGVNRANFTDSRLNQVMLSLSFKIFDSEAAPKRRRGGNCYF